MLPEVEIIIGIINTFYVTFGHQNDLVQVNYKYFIKYFNESKYSKQSIDIVFYFILISKFDINTPNTTGIKNITSITNRDIQQINIKKTKAMIEDNQIRIISQKKSFTSDMYDFIELCKINITQCFDVTQTIDLNYIKKIRYLTRQICRLYNYKPKKFPSISFSKPKITNISDKYQLVIDLYKEFWSNELLKIIGYQQYSKITEMVLSNISYYYKRNLTRLISSKPLSVILEDRIKEFIN